MDDTFTLHPKLVEDTVFVTDLPLCRVTLMNDTRFPWLILIPRKEGLRELHQLTKDARDTVMDECALMSEILEDETKAEKMNIAALGNAVPQLHIHIIARFSQDPAWPSPIWGVGEAVAYENSKRALFIDQLCDQIRRRTQASPLRP